MANYSDILTIKTNLTIKISNLVKIVFRSLQICIFGWGVQLAHAEELNAENLAAQIHIPYEKFQLSNGLTVIVHQDRKAPLIALNIWYHVGSKDERLGKTGFAHLFEHLMFNGTAHYKGEYMLPLEKAGASDLNGTTNVDRTNYFVTVPKEALDLALWMEAERMGHLLPALDQAKLNEQRGVVQNEKRQRENQPYGLAGRILLPKYSYPPEHPYSWPTIGSMEDLNAATLDDVQQWFRDYYGPNNAVLVLAGDIDVATARAKVERYFGDIPPGPQPAHVQQWIAKHNETKRVQVYDRVSTSRLYRLWNVPGLKDPASDYLELAAFLLGGHEQSRLYQRLVLIDQLATFVQAFYDGREIAGQFGIVVDAKPGVDLTKIDTILAEEMEKFIKRGPNSDELSEAKIILLSNMLRQLENIGGFGSKSDILAAGEIYFKDPSFYQQGVRQLSRASAKQIQQVARQWLDEHTLQLTVLPTPQLQPTLSSFDRSIMPSVGSPSAWKFPVVARATLKNGLQIALIERHHAPLIDMSLQFDAGYAVDGAMLAGRGPLTLAMLKEGTKTRSAEQIEREEQALGSSITVANSLDSAEINLSTLKASLPQAMTLFADVVQHPSFPQASLARLQEEWLIDINQEKNTPNQFALRVLPKLLYGSKHPYAGPWTGSGTSSVIRHLKTEQLQEFHQTYLCPQHATLLVVGDTTLTEITQLIERDFAKWSCTHAAPKITLPNVELPKQARVFLWDKPGAPQSWIVAGQVMPAISEVNYPIMKAMNAVLGGSFNSRLNMNLREDKHWAYFAYSSLVSAKGPQPWLATTSVQTDKTLEAIDEMQREFTDYVTQRGPTSQELNRVIDGEVRKLPASLSTNAHMLAHLEAMTRYDFSDQYLTHYREAMQQLTPSKLHDQARQWLHPQQLTWVIVGDKQKIEASLRRRFPQLQVLQDVP